MPAAGCLPAPACGTHRTRGGAALYLDRVSAQRRDCRHGGTQRLQYLLSGRGHRLRTRPIADLRTGPVGACGRAASAQRCGPDSALPAPRRFRVRRRSHVGRRRRSLRAAGAHTVRCGLPRAGFVVLRGARQAGMRREHARRQPGDSVTQRRRESGLAGGWRPTHSQYRVHAQIEAGVSPGRRAARLGAHG